MGKKLVPGVLSPEEENFVESVVNTIGYALLVKRKQYYESLLLLRKHYLCDLLKNKLDEGVQFVQNKDENDLLKFIFVTIAEIGLYKEKKPFKALRNQIIVPDIVKHRLYPTLFESVTGLTIMGYRLKVEEQEE